ncbi:hypothetical protein [Klebsiella michiganensis]|uniref:hypothetical protein n=1 Tax=Klebsiella michiganensis TaxID=1134687 RepID=UPI0034A0C092
MPVKEGLHNRHMVGLTAWHTFFQTTHLTLHEKKVLVIGYGLVGQGLRRRRRPSAARSWWRKSTRHEDYRLPTTAGTLLNYRRR